MNKLIFIPIIIIIASIILYIISVNAPKLQEKDR